jgi:hypothetical protein
MWVKVKVLPVFPPVVAIERVADLPADVVTDVAFEEEKRIGAATVIVTTFVTVAPVKSVAVIVSIYVPARTVAATRMIAELAVLVSRVIPGVVGDTTCVKVFRPIPFVATYACELAEDPRFVPSVDEPLNESATEY